PGRRMVTRPSPARTLSRRAEMRRWLACPLASSGSCSRSLSTLAYSLAQSKAPSTAGRWHATNSSYKPPLADKDVGPIARAARRSTKEPLKDEAAHHRQPRRVDLVLRGLLGAIRLRLIARGRFTRSEPVGTRRRQRSGRGLLG